MLKLATYLNTATQRCSAIVVVLVIFSSCQKESTGFVEVKGHVVDYFTKEPIKVEVSLYGDDATSAKSSTQGSILLTKGSSDSDGTFNLSTKPSKRHNYYINIFGGDFNKLTIKENQSNDLGEFLAGSHKFYCNISLIPRSDSTFVLQKEFAPGTKVFAPGTRVTIKDSVFYYKASFDDYKQSYHISYTTVCPFVPNYRTDYHKLVPIKTLTGTLSATISY